MVWFATVISQNCSAFQQKFVCVICVESRVIIGVEEVVRLEGYLESCSSLWVLVALNLKLSRISFSCVE